MEMGPDSLPVESTLGLMLPEATWVTPIADVGVAPESADPAEVAQHRGSIRLAFIAAPQHLPARQRAALILCAVLRWQVAEAAELLATSVPAANSALQRARATLRETTSDAELEPLDEADAELLGRYVGAFERYAIEQLVTLLRDDAVQSMPPIAMWIRGAANIGRWMVEPGPSGAGKSTTVHMLCTLLAPTGGWALVAGYDVGSDPGKVRLRIGVTLQEAALDPKQTGTELLQLQGRLYGLTRREANQRVPELAEVIDLGDFLDRLIGTCSGGMKCRLDLAAALIGNPQVVFLDEPTTGLGPVSRVQVWSEVRRLNVELGITIFLTTQYLEEADELAHRVGIIDHGRIVAEGTPTDPMKAVGSDVIMVRVEGEPGLKSTCAI